MLEYGNDGFNGTDMKNFFAKLFKIDKRKEQRFQIDDHDLIIFDPNAPQEKQILDLSMKGISFIYTDEGL